MVNNKENILTKKKIWDTNKNIEQTHTQKKNYKILTDVSSGKCV